MAETKKVWRQGKGHAVTVKLRDGSTIQLSTPETTADGARSAALRMAAQLEAATPSTATQAPAVQSPPSVTPAPPQAPAPVGPGRLGEAFKRYAPAPAAAPAGPAAQPAAAPAAPGELTYDPAEQAELAKMLGRVFSSVNKGVVGWSVRMLGKKPEPPTDEEEKVIDKAWAMQVKRWARGRELSPLLVIAGGSIGMGIGMYRDGEPLPDTRPDAEVVPLKPVPPEPTEKSPPTDAS